MARRAMAEHLELLGLQTYGEEQKTRRRPVFKYKPVIELYKIEIPSLFGLLHRNEGAVHDRNDPLLFDQELDTLLATFGPQIWPELGHGSRDHLRQSQEGTLYTSDLVYPRDSAILKKHMRGIILCKRIAPETDLDALITKTHKDSKLKIFQAANSGQITPQKRKSHDTTTAEPSQLRRPMDTESSGNENDSNVGTQTRQQTRRKGPLSTEIPPKIELRIYRRTTQIVPPSSGPVWSYGTLFLSPEWGTSGDFFSRVCEKIETDCSFTVFQLPEDMSHEGQIRLDRGSRDSEATFQRIVDIFQKARRYPGEPQHRSVEVEVGLDMPTDD